MTIQQLVKLYQDAEKRAKDCSGGPRGEGGKSFQPEDRLVLIRGMLAGNIDRATLARAVAKGETTSQEYYVAYARLTTFTNQARSGRFRQAGDLVRTTELIPALVTPIEEQPFDGRIKTRADIQPAFNRAAQQLARLGITNVADAQAYLANGFEFIRVQQKIDQSAERVLRELQIGQLSKDQVIAVLEQVKAKF
jgi:hypothetical protein